MGDIHDIFSRIQAEEALKRKTASFILDEMQAKKSMVKARRLRYAFAAAAFAAVVFVGVVSYIMYITPNAYIDIDINPSVELSLNRFGRVVKASPYNDGSAEILTISNIHNATYTEAVTEIVNLMAAAGYLNRDGGLLSLTVQAVSADSENEMMDRLTATINAVLQARGSQVETEIFPVSQEVKNYAHEHHVSPAKYLAITELQQVDPTASFSSCSGHSISELRNLAQEHGGNHHAEYPANDSADDVDDIDIAQNNCETSQNEHGHHKNHH